MALLEPFVKVVELLGSARAAVIPGHHLLVTLEDLLVGSNRGLVALQGLLVVLQLQLRGGAPSESRELLPVLAAPSLEIAHPGLVLSVVLDMVLVMVRHRYSTRSASKTPFG